tara:strand:- start:929 stop:1339 length:411 start_codon:yes stop_codon:yes gene_type:complete
MNSTEQPGFAESWERSKPHLVTALKKSGDEYDVDELLAMIEDGRAIFYPIKNGAAVFRVSVYPRKRRLRLWLIGGEVGEDFGLFHSLGVVMEAAESLAKKYGCDGIECTGRKVYERVLKPYGYNNQAVVLTKELGG